jgi:hypothetical protein
MSGFRKLKQKLNPAQNYDDGGIVTPDQPDDSWSWDRFKQHWGQLLGPPMSAVDSVTGAPLRSAIGQLQDNPTNLSGAIDAAASQFAADPRTAPTPEDLTRRSGLTNPAAQAALETSLNFADPMLIAGGVGAAMKAPEAYRALRGLGEAGELRLGSPAAEAVKSVAQPGELNQFGMYSKLERAIQDKMGPTATRQQVEGILRDIKPEERQYSGIDEYLNNLKANDLKTDVSNREAAGEATGKHIFDADRLQTELDTPTTPETKVNKQDLLDQLTKKRLPIKEITKATKQDLPNFATWAENKGVPRDEMQMDWDNQGPLYKEY